MPWFNFDSFFLLQISFCCYGNECVFSCRHLQADVSEFVIPVFLSYGIAGSSFISFRNETYLQICVEVCILERLLAPVGSRSGKIALFILTDRHNGAFEEAESYFLVLDLWCCFKHHVFLCATNRCGHCQEQNHSWYKSFLHTLLF